MGKRGPAKRPTNLTVLAGNPGKRPLTKNEPKPKPIAADCPDWLNDEAKAIWNNLAPKLEPLGLLTEVDWLEFQNLCIAAAQIKQAQQVIDKYGLITEAPSGYLQQRPEVSIVNKSITLVTKLASKFGLSPSDRAGLSLPEKNNADAFEEFLTSGKKKK